MRNLQYTSRQNHRRQNYQDGQTLVLIVLIMLIALSVGLLASDRLIGTLRVNTNELKNYRSSAVSTSAMERMLLKTDQQLEDYINFGNCGADCTLQISLEDGQVGYASVHLSYLGNSTNPYQVLLSQTEFSQINVDGYPNNTNLSVCWNSSAGSSAAVVAYLVRGSVGSYTTQNYAYNSVGSIEQNGFSTASAGNGFNNCFSIGSGTNPRMLRLKSAHADFEAFVIPAPGQSLPKQGILIESVGVLDNVRTTNKVIRIFNPMPAEFDYMLFQKSTTAPLSNQ